MFQSNLNVLSKLDECSHAHARKIFATTRMLGFSLKFSAVHLGKKTMLFPLWQKWETLGKENAYAMKTMNVSGKMLSRFVDVLLKLTARSSVPGSRVNPTRNILFVNMGYL